MVKEYFLGNIKGDKGDQGVKGEQGIQGGKGDKGDKGDKGNTPSFELEENGDLYVVTPD